MTADLAGLPPEQAFNLGALTAELLAEAEARGYQRAIDALRDGERLEAWFTARLEEALSRTGERPWPPNEWPPSREYAAYLEASAQTAIRSGESTE